MDYLSFSSVAKQMVIWKLLPTVSQALDDWTHFLALSPDMFVFPINPQPTLYCIETRRPTSFIGVMDSPNLKLILPP